MKIYKKAVLAVSIFAMAAGAAMTSAGAQETYLPPIMVQGTVSEKTETRVTVDNQNPGAYSGAFVLHVTEETRLLDAADGMSVSIEDLQTGDAVYAYAGPAVMASIPPQAAASVILTNIPEDGTAPHYIQVASMAQRSGGRQINASDGSSYWVSDACTVFPYLTRNMLYPQSIFEGAWCLVWPDAQGNAQKIMMFPPYGPEQDETVQSQGGWKLERV